MLTLQRALSLGLLYTGCLAVTAADTNQFILLNLNWSATPDGLAEIRKEFPLATAEKTRVGVAAIFSYLHRPREKVCADLREFLRQAQRAELPIVVQLDGENWWSARSDLWNWWDPDRPGFSPSNRLNVEWTDWSPDAAIKIAWRNWGRQLRVLPPPNLFSPRYRAACHEEMRVLIPIVLEWWQALPANQKHLFVGIKLGWESSIGVNAWYYPNGNALFDQPADLDPKTGLRSDEPPMRGVVQIGYAAVKSAGIRGEGKITEADLAEVARRHLEDLCKEAANLKVPRERLFTHAAGWKDGEALYDAAVNTRSCPGWSFYRHAGDPGKDAGVQRALKACDAPYWAAVEWLFNGTSDTQAWQTALTTTLSQPRCRYVCIYNWASIRENRPALEAIRELTQSR